VCQGEIGSNFRIIDDYHWQRPHFIPQLFTTFPDGTLGRRLDLGLRCKSFTVLTFHIEFYSNLGLRMNSGNMLAQGKKQSRSHTRCGTMIIRARWSCGGRHTEWNGRD
jgi:hypothetical protein